MKGIVSTASVFLLAVSASSGSENPHADKLTSVDPAWAVTAEEGYRWALVKDANLPTMTGSPEWINYMAFLEKKLL